jgi:hypothetical protein
MVIITPALVPLVGSRSSIANMREQWHILVNKIEAYFFA